MTTVSRKKRDNRSRKAKPSKVKAREQHNSAGNDSRVAPIAWRSATPVMIGGGAILLATFAWAYWPTIVELFRAWNREPDYSHGYFVLPLALFFLWVRRDSFPGLPSNLAWPGLVLIAMSIGIRMFGAQYFVGGIDGWSMLFWVAGMVWLFGGWRILWWSLPSVVFLWFMIPLPWRVERWLSLPLQHIATKLSCWTLQCLGQPAIAEGNTIYLGDIQMGVEQACSGLRIFVGIVALAFAYVVLVRREWWERALLLVSVLPIALVANAARIVVTGLLYRFVSGEAAHKFSHDMAGWVMIPFAAMLFALVLWYLDRLVHDVEVTDVGDLVRSEHV